MKLDSDCSKLFCYDYRLRELAEIQNHADSAIRFYSMASEMDLGYCRRMTRFWCRVKARAVANLSAVRAGRRDALSEPLL